MTMSINRERLYDKIRALLAKTTENGCTEAEALAALAKARAMMDAYEVTVDDLKLAKEQAAILKGTDTRNDKHGIARYLVRAVSVFCDCDGWRKGDGFVFCGTPADVQLADWLHHHLIDFVRVELFGYLAKNDHFARGERRRMINGFVLGCTARITNRVMQIVAEARAKQATASNARALVIVKTDAIREAKQAAGITLTTRTRRSAYKYDNGSLEAGKAAGNRATLARPVDTARGAMLLK